MYKTDTASNYTDLMAKVCAFATATGSAFNVTRTGSGNGTLYAKGGVNSIIENYTLTALSSSTFSVIGSFSGNLGTLTVGVEFSSATVTLTVTAGSTAFSAGDTFTFSTAPKWAFKRDVAGSEAILEGPGSNGAGGVFVGFLAYSNPSADYYNLRLCGFTGYTPGVSFLSQPGATTSPPSISLWNNAIPFSVYVNARRIIIVAKVSTVYQVAYLGLAEPYADSSVYPYMLAIGGTTVTDIRFSDTSVKNSVFPIAAWDNNTAGSNAGSQCRLRLPSGEWKGFYSDIIRTIWPESSMFTSVENNLGGGTFLLPVILNSTDPVNIYCQFDGVYRLPGFGLGAETELTVNNKLFTVYPNSFRSTRNDYFAILKD